MTDPVTTWLQENFVSTAVMKTDTNARFLLFTCGYPLADASKGWINANKIRDRLQGHFTSPKVVQFLPARRSLIPT